MSVSLQMPPFGVVAAALRKTTEHLAHEVAKPTESTPHWTDFEWAVARSVAAMQGISFLLAGRLRWRGPPLWQSFLEEQRAQCVLRDAEIGALLRRLDAAARDAGIGCVALKGSALRALGVYAPGERPMGDIDLLVREADLAATAAMMDRLGYRGTKVPDREIVYEPLHKSPPKGFAEHVENPLKVEVHTAIAEPLPVRKVDITRRLQPIDPQSGLNAYPSLAVLLLHLLLRVASNMRAHTLRQIQLHDIAIVAGRLLAADWEALLGESCAANARWWMYPPLALTARYYPCNVPREVLHDLRVACPPILRALSEREELTNVSWSNLRIGAFPGMAWSRTPADVLRYVRSRLLPDRNALGGIAAAIELQPHLGAIPWYQLSHGRRIVRWLSSRPPRVQTMLSVTAALRDGT